MQADELSLATRAAWLSYVGNQTQEEIAGRLGVSRVKVNRLIGQAVRAGLVHVFVEGTAAECIALEEAIASRWGLEFCTVAPAAEDAPLPLATLAAAGGHWLHRVLEAGPRLADRGRPWPHAGGAWSRNLPRLPRPGRPLRLAAGQPHPPRRRQPVRRHPSADRDHRRPRATSCRRRSSPTASRTSAVLLGQRSLEAVFALARAAELVVVGIGEVGPQLASAHQRHDHGRGVRARSSAPVRWASCWAASSTPTGGPVAAGDQRAGPGGAARGAARPAGGGDRRRPRQGARDRGRARRAGCSPG